MSKVSLRAIALSGVAARGALVGAAVVGAFLGTYAIGINAANSADGLDGIGIFLLMLMLLPVVAVVVGVAAGMALRLPMGWLTGLVAPVTAFGVNLPFDWERPLLIAEVIAVYAAVATAVAALRPLGDPPRGPSGAKRPDWRPRPACGGRPTGPVVTMVAIADAVLFVAALGIAANGVNREPGIDVNVTMDLPPSSAAAAMPPKEGNREEAAARPRPSPATPMGPWSATLAAKGDHVEVGTPGRVVGGIKHVSIGFGSAATLPRGHTGSDLQLPDGSRWTPDGTIRLEGPDDLAFKTARIFRGSLTVGTTLDDVLASAPGGVTAVGRLTSADGRQVDRLVLPVGTRRDTCQRSARVRCGEYEPAPLQVSVTQVPGLRIQAAGDGEVSVAGTARVSAAGHSWDGLVAAVEARQLRVSATYGDGGWAVTAEGAKARQVWMDVWPVIETEIAAKAVMEGKRSFLHPLRTEHDLPLRIRWKNVGHATSQILEAEGQGTGAKSVGFRLAMTSGHDAGIGLSRQPEVRNLKRGLDIPSKLKSGKSIERGLSFEPGAEASIILRGNFPTVTVSLPTGAE